MRVAVTGAAGQLGSRLVRAFSEAGDDVVALARPEFTLEDPKVPDGLDLVVNAAAWTDVDGCARDPERAMWLNGDAAGVLASATHRSGARFIHISTNEVFSGVDRQRYDEDAATGPINAYGRSKLRGEEAVRRAHPTATIIRTAWVYGGPRSFPAKIASAATRAAAAGEPLRVVTDEIGNPTPADDLAERIAELARRPEAPAILHIAGEPAVSRFRWAERILAHVGDRTELRAISSADFERASTAPPHAVLDTGLARSLDLAEISWELRPALR